MITAAIMIVWRCAPCLSLSGVFALTEQNSRSSEAISRNCCLPWTYQSRIIQPAFFFLRVEYACHIFTDWPYTSAIISFYLISYALSNLLIDQILTSISFLILPPLDIFEGPVVRKRWENLLNTLNNGSERHSLLTGLRREMNLQHRNE